VQVTCSRLAAGLCEAAKQDGVSTADKSSAPEQQRQVPLRQTRPDRVSILRCVLYATAGTRHYHNLEHLMSVFDFVSFCTKAGVVLQDPAAIDWAVWFHDIIYDPRR
jgi:predicted metal-dependent HD superfamily phosphohydrolase